MSLSRGTYIGNDNVPLFIPKNKCEMNANLNVQYRIKLVRIFIADNKIKFVQLSSFSHK